MVKMSKNKGQTWPANQSVASLGLGGHTDSSREANGFLSCFLLSNFAGVRRFLLLFTFLTSEILSI